MTLRTQAGQALLDWFGGPMRDENSLAKHIAAIEQEVRDDIRAPLDVVSGYVLAASWPNGTPMEAHRQEAIAALDRVLVAISRHESATEDGERPWDHPYEGTAEYPDRCIHCGLVGSYAHTEELYRKWVTLSGFRFTDATPTPDDRDREVERIAALLHDEFWDDTVAREEGEACCLPSANRLYDAGLRASGRLLVGGRD